ncbi:helix-turn-helix domain-containing protein [Fructobacillus fructosus]|uniref:helix-turn-helix domain-containing protein n=1 Tax=Fructobacillus fructosus TaxID=1631 RepID=UPI004033ADBD
MNGNRLKQLRKERGLTINQLHEITGISAPMIYKIEHDEKKIGLHTLIKLADYFDMSLDDLVGRERRKNGEY